MTNFKQLTLPCLRGVIGNWVYYCTVIPFKELPRIDTEHKIKEDRSLDKWLQRELHKRVQDIKDYLLKEDERFFNSIIVGVYGEIPDWYSLDISILKQKFNIQISEGISSSLGVLTLSGKEILFTIDGQHRIEAIKLAQASANLRFKDDELPVIFVAHSDDEKGFVRTRKLFATINREARKPSKNDLAIIDETYAYNIVARMLYARYVKFKNKIALTENNNLDRNDHTNFTNLLTLTEVNKKLFTIINYKESKFSSPSYEIRETLFKVCTEFYDFSTENIKDYKSFFSGEKGLEHFRNSANKKPLNLLFLPIGLNLIAQIYIYFKMNGRLNELKKNINKLNFDLYKGHFKFIYFNPVQNKVVTAYQVFGKAFALYLLGEDVGLSDLELKAQLAKAYSINELSPEFKTFKLPNKVRRFPKKF